MCVCARTQIVRVTPLLQSLDISQAEEGYVPSLDDVAAAEVVSKRPGSRLTTVRHIRNRDPVTVTPSLVGQLWGFTPHLTTLIVTHVRSINALPVELLRCPKLRIVTASPELVLLPPPEITTDGYTAIKPYLEDARNFGVTHFPFVKLVFSGSGREGVPSLLDALRHAYFWPFGGLPGRNNGDHSLLGSYFQVKYPGGEGVGARLRPVVTRMCEESFDPARHAFLFARPSNSNGVPDGGYKPQVNTGYLSTFPPAYTGSEFEDGRAGPFTTDQLKLPPDGGVDFTAFVRGVESEVWQEVRLRVCVRSVSLPCVSVPSRLSSPASCTQSCRWTVRCMWCV